MSVNSLLLATSIVELIVEIVKYPLRDVETLFRSAMGRKRVGHRAGTIVGIVHIGCRSLNRFRPMDLRGIDLSGKSLAVVELCQVREVLKSLNYGPSQFGSLVFAFPLRIAYPRRTSFLSFRSYTE